MLLFGISLEFFLEGWGGGDIVFFCFVLIFVFWFFFFFFET